MNALSHILKYQIVAIIRGAHPKDVLHLAEAIYEGGIKSIEITLNSEDAFSLIETLAHKMRERVLIGAGTVLDAASAQTAISSGAEFIISPTLDVETILVTKKHNKVSLPGAYTPTEILQAFKSGGDIIKVFPAGGCVDYIKDLKGPLPDIPLMPTGGITLHNIALFKKAGAAAFGIGSALVDTKEKVSDAYLHSLREKASQFVRAIHSLKIE